MAQNYYETLGVPKSATKEQIKDAYRKLVMKYHPDVNKDPKAKVKMQELNEAYAVLSDDQKKAKYDSFGPDQFGQQFSEEDIFRGFDPDDILKSVFGQNFGQFGDVFSGGGGQGAEPAGMNLYLPFTDIERGIDKEFKVQRYETCHNCKGSGGEPGSKQVRCSSCNGSGRRQFRQNTILGTIQMMATCDRCRGRGKVYDEQCHTCRGQGQVLVTEHFRVRVERTDKDTPGKGGGRMFGIF